MDSQKTVTTDDIVSTNMDLAPYRSKICVTVACMYDGLAVSYRQKISYGRGVDLRRIWRMLAYWRVVRFPQLPIFSRDAPLTCEPGGSAGNGTCALADAT
jgi:hypothetical protein